MQKFETGQWSRTTSTDVLIRAVAVLLICFSSSLDIATGHSFDECTRLASVSACSPLLRMASATVVHGYSNSQSQSSSIGRMEHDHTQVQPIAVVPELRLDLIQQQQQQQHQQLFGSPQVIRSREIARLSRTRTVKDAEFIGGGGAQLIGSTPVLPYSIQVAPISSGGLFSPVLPPPTSALNEATNFPPVSETHGLVIPRRIVHWKAWILAYSIPLLLWIASSIFAFVRSAVFFEPDAPDVSSSWVMVGWVLNWTALVLHSVLLTVIILKRSPYNSITTMGSQFLLTLAALAAIAHSNSLLSSDVTTPVSNDKAIVVQLEWLAVAVMLCVFLALLWGTPRRIPIPIMAQLSRRTKAEVMMVQRGLQGEVSELSQRVEYMRNARLQMGQAQMTGIKADGIGSAGEQMYVDANGRIQILNPTSSLSKAALGSILSSTRGDLAFSNRDTGGDTHRTTARTNASSSRETSREQSRLGNRGTTAGAGSEDEEELRNMTASKRASRRASGHRRATTLDTNNLSVLNAAAHLLQHTTDSRALRRQPTQGDHHLQKLASAWRAEEQEKHLHGHTASAGGGQFLRQKSSGRKKHSRAGSKDSSTTNSLRGTASGRHRKTATSIGAGGGGVSNSSDFFANAQRIIAQQQSEQMKAEGRV
jgi:hypothetical protein